MNEINFTLGEALKACDGNFTGNEALLDAKITGASIDSRLLQQGNLFIAIKGDKTDGYNFIPNAMDMGAICAVSERAYEGYPCIVVKNPVTALQNIAKAYRLKLSITVVGITGSVGKTTTKEFVASVLSERYNVCKTEGNYNNGIGLPLTVLSIKPDTDVAVIEMGMNHFGEMRLLASIARPTMCIITNIGISHIENLGSRENIFSAKSEIFEYMSQAARCIMNGDDDLLKNAGRNNECLYGFNDDNDVYIESYKEKGFDGTDFSVSFFGESIECSVKIPGRHILFAAMAAMASGSWLGLSREQLIEGVKNTRSISGRTNVIKCKNYTLIDDCYNAAPQSVMSGIDTLTKCDEGRTVCILGDMGELGDEASIQHESVGIHVAKCSVGLLIAIGELSKETYKGAVSHGATALYYETKEDFLSHAKDIIEKDDVILIKASHAMEFNKIVDALKD